MSLSLSRLVDCKDLRNVLSLFCNLPALDRLCRVSKGFKGHFLEAGHKEACKMHKVGLCRLLFLGRIDYIEPSSFPDPLEIEKISAFAHERAVRKTMPTHLSPLLLYGRLIRNTHTNVFFYDCCRRFHISRFLERANRIRLFFSVFYHLQQASVCLPEQWALATRRSVEFNISTSQLISNMSVEFINCHEKNIILNPKEVDKQLKCMIKITKLNPSAPLRASSQAALAALRTKLEKIALAH